MENESFTGEEVPIKAPARKLKRPRPDEGRYLAEPLLVLIHSDALIDGRQALAHTVAEVVKNVTGKRISVFDFEISEILSQNPQLENLYRFYLPDSNNISGADLQNIKLQHAAVMKREGYGMMVPQRGVGNLFEQLNRRGIPVVIVSSSQRAVTEFLKSFSLYHLVAKVVGAEDIFSHGLDSITSSVHREAFRPCGNPKLRDIKPARSVAAKIKMENIGQEDAGMDLDPQMPENSDVSPAELDSGKSTPGQVQAAAITTVATQQKPETPSTASSGAQDCKLQPQDLLFIFSAHYNAGMAGDSGVKTYWVRPFSVDAAKPSGSTNVEQGQHFATGYLDMVVDSLDELCHKIEWAEDTGVANPDLGTGIYGSNLTEDTNTHWPGYDPDQLYPHPGGLTRFPDPSDNCPGGGQGSSTFRVEKLDDKEVICLD